MNKFLPVKNFLFNLTNNLNETCVIIRYRFCRLKRMVEQNPNEEVGSKKFQIAIGERIAYIEVISLTNYICAVEFPGSEPIFITKIRDRDNKPCWVSIPQGNDELAVVIGAYIDEQLGHKK